MKTYPLAMEGGHPLAFEIGHTFLSRRTVAHLLSRIKEVTDVRLASGSSEGIRVEFKYLNVDYQVCEPYGDNSRCWIGPTDMAKNAGDISGIEAVFQFYRPRPWEIIGDLLTSGLCRRFGRRD